METKTSSVKEILQNLNDHKVRWLTQQSVGKNPDPLFQRLILSLNILPQLYVQCAFCLTYTSAAPESIGTHIWLVTVIVS